MSTPTGRAGADDDSAQAAPPIPVRPGDADTSPAGAPTVGGSGPAPDAEIAAALAMAQRIGRW